MVELFTIENLFTLMVLTALETVLGFDNLLYISIEAPEICTPARHDSGHRLAHRSAVRDAEAHSLFQAPWFGFDLPVAKGEFNGHSLIVLVGGAFLIRR